jgi:hypothetical protein
MMAHAVKMFAKAVAHASLTESHTVPNSSSWWPAKMICQVTVVVQ